MEQARQWEAIEEVAGLVLTRKARPTAPQEGQVEADTEEDHEEVVLMVLEEEPVPVLSTREGCPSRQVDEEECPLRSLAVEQALEDHRTAVHQLAATVHQEEAEEEVDQSRVCQVGEGSQAAEEDEAISAVGPRRAASLLSKRPRDLAVSARRRRRRNGNGAARRMSAARLAVRERPRGR